MNIRQICGFFFIAIAAVLLTNPFVNADTIYLAEAGGLMKYDLNGNRSTFASSTYVLSFALDNGGNLCGIESTTIVPLETMAYAIKKFDSSGNATTVVDAGVNTNPRYFQFDSSGNAYVTYPDKLTSRGITGAIEKFDSSGHDLGILLFRCRCLYVQGYGH